MKKLAFTAIAATVAAVTYGQGTIYVDNSANTGVYNGNGGSAANPTYSAAVTQNGLIFTTDTTAQAGTLGGTSGSTLIGQDFSWALYGGTTDSSSALTLIATQTGSATSGDNASWGEIQDQTGAFYSVPGSTAGATVYLELYVWEGTSYTTYNAAKLGGDYVGDSGVFANPSGGSGSPPGPASYLDNVPDVLVTVPEPGTMALAALGGASLLMFRRKK